MWTDRPLAIPLGLASRCTQYRRIPIREAQPLEPDYLQMSDAPANQHPRDRLWFAVLALVVLTVVAVVVFLAVTCVQIVHTASLEELHPADVIIVFGAAEYAGHPSPVLRARLDHAFDLYQRHLARVVITTGGAAADPTFSEGGVGNDYLRKRGIPENALIAETQGSDTAESAQRVAVIMRANSLHSCVAVSDAYHVFRIRKLLEHEKIGPVYVAPRPDSRPHTTLQRGIAVFREAASYLVWKLGI
jgi:uncharacterized SAM-binding protein YcdF (DUF218 family)